MKEEKKTFRLIAALATILSIVACNLDGRDPQIATTALDAGRGFIGAALQGNFNTAEFYVLKDSANLNLLENYKMWYRKQPVDERRGFKEASIIINSEETLNDSTVILNFSNSFKRTPQVLKLVKKDGGWLVDFTYTAKGNF